MKNESCPVNSDEQKCAVVSSDLINSVGKYISNRVPFSDISKLVNMSSKVLYNEEATMMGPRKLMAVNLAGSGSWLRLNVSELSDKDIQQLLKGIKCK